jgi:hypothetical protein
MPGTRFWLSRWMVPVLALLVLTQHERGLACFYAVWSLVSWVAFWRRRGRPEPDRFDPTVVSRRAVFAAGSLGSMSATLVVLGVLADDNARIALAVVPGAPAAFSLWVAGFAVTPAGRRRLGEARRRHDAMTLPVVPTVALPLASGDTTSAGPGGWQPGGQPPYFG